MSTDAKLVLAMDTCGPSGSVALARLTGDGVEVLGQVALEGRTYSATLVAAVRELLREHGVALDEVRALVVVKGPGSFTGVRVGLSAAKGLAEGAGLAVIGVSRLAVLAHKSGCAAGALDAHRHEVFLRVGEKELLASGSELAKLAAPARVAVCDAAVDLLKTAWPGAELVQIEPPDSSDALRLALPRLKGGERDDAAEMDGNYLRRSDAEIFGPQPA